MMLYCIKALGVLMVLSVSLRAQTCGLSYTLEVRDEFQAPYEAPVFLKNRATQRLIEPKSPGIFIVESLCEGTYSFQLLPFNCKDSMWVVELKASTNHRITLPHYLHLLHDVHVIARRPDHATLLFTQTLDSKTVERNQAKGLAEVLAQSNGVHSVKNGPGISKVMIHGLQGNRVLLLQEGQRLESQSWGADHAPEVDAFLMTAMELIKGPASVRYGSDAMGGVVLLRTPELPDSGGLQALVQTQYFTNGRMPVGMLQLQGHADTRGHLAWRLHASGKYGGTVSSPGYLLKNTGQWEGNAAVQTAYHNTRWGTDILLSRYTSAIGLYSGSHISNLSDLKAALQSSVPLVLENNFSYLIEAPRQYIRHTFFKNAWHAHINRTWNVQGSYSYQLNQRDEYDVHGSNHETEPASRFMLQGWQAEAVLEHAPWHGLNGQWGLQYNRQQNNVWASAYLPNYVQQGQGVFVLEQWPCFITSNGPAVLEMGGRWDTRYLQSYFYNGKVLSTPLLQFQQWSGQTGLQIPLSPKTTFLVHWGTAWRPPSPLELYAQGLHHSLGTFEKGNAQLKIEHLQQVQCHIRTQGTQRWDVQAYYNRFLNYIYLNPTGTYEITLRGAYPVFEFLQTPAQLMGLDVSHEWTLLKQLQLRNQYSMVRGFETGSGRALIQLPADRIRTQLDWKVLSKDVEHVITLGGLWVNKQWRVPASRDFAPSPEAYAIFFISTEHRFKLWNRSVSCGIELQNLFNTRYRDYLDRFRYFTDAPGRTLGIFFRGYF